MIDCDILKYGTVTMALFPAINDILLPDLAPSNHGIADHGIITAPGCILMSPAVPVIVGGILEEYSHLEAPLTSIPTALL
jgi:hypothetical protein